MVSEVPAEEYASVPGRAVWCVYELGAVAERDYSPADMPRHLCSVFVCAYATLVRRGRLAPRDSYQATFFPYKRTVGCLEQSKKNSVKNTRTQLPSCPVRIEHIHSSTLWAADAVKNLQSVARDPRRDVYLALAGPGTPHGVASETASSTRYRTQLCEHLEDVLEDLDLQGALFHWPSPYRDTLWDAVVARQFVGAMETCLGAFSKKMALVVPENELERKHFFPFIDGTRLSYNVVFWTHELHKKPGSDTMAHCAVNLPQIVNLQADLKKTAPALHNQAVVTASLRALQFHLLVTEGPNKLSRVEPTKTRTLPYTAVCRETVPNQSQWHWSMSKEDGCVHGTYQNQWMASIHDASDIYFANFTTGVAIFDMAYDDFQGVCGQKHPLTTMIVRGLNISHIIH
ncbi:uncharacterized protein [Dermacentor andersoni]|uniref:uncharacterized protein n=1 Tax=Dermacentor andersoni TaxID=34620 RepID=UPI00241787E9|nr:uncharacterized protein LOC129385255 [Dermacentor andersoni]